MNRRPALALFGLLILTQCGGPPPPPPKPPPVLSLTITGGTDQNQDSGGRASPVAVRIYQLSGTAKFEQTDVFALKDREAPTLGAESQGSQEFLIAPGEKRTVTISLKPLVSSIGVAVMYRDIDRARWRTTQPANANGQTKISVTVGKLAVAMRTERPDLVFEAPEGLSPAAKEAWEKANAAAAKAAGDAAEKAAAQAGQMLPGQMLPKLAP